MTRRYHHGNLRAALLRAGLGLLDRLGPDGVTIRAVARAARVSHAAPANHFHDRRALLTALAADLFRQLASRVDAALATATTGADRVAAFAEALTEFGLRHPSRYRLLWRRDLLANDDAELAGTTNRIYQRLIVELTSLRGSCDVHTYAVGLWSLVHGYVSLRLDGVFVEKADSLSGEPRRRAIVTAFLSPIGGERENLRRAKVKRRRRPG